MPEWPLLWLTCRHHIQELFIKYASIAIRGETKGSDDPLLKSLNVSLVLLTLVKLDKRTVWKLPNNVCDLRHYRTNEVLLWADTHMQKATWPREDYR